MTNQTMETILHRRSIRKYTAEGISEESLEQILQAGLYAANGGNHQVVRLFVLHGEHIDELNDAIVQTMASRPIDPSSYQNKSVIRAKGPSCHFFFHAPVLILAVAPADHANSMADSACALENMQIAAASFGLGSCWINTPHWTTDEPLVRELLTRYGVRPEESVFGSVIVGHSDGDWPEPKPRKEGRIVRVS